MELVLIRGLPGSGKSTLAKSMVDFHHFEADMYFEDPVDGEYKFDKTKISAAHNWCMDTTRLFLTYGRSVVVSNTFTQKWEMQPYLDMAEDMEIPVRVIEAKGNFKNVHGVPDEAIERMRARWEQI